MKRFAALVLVAAVSLLGACNSTTKSGGSFGIPDGTLGEIRITIGTQPSCVGGANAGMSCDPHGDCPGNPDAFCIGPSVCHGDAGNGNPCTVAGDCADVIPTCNAGTCLGDVDNGDPCLTAADCTDTKPTCDFECDRGDAQDGICALDTDCPGGTCTTALIHSYTGTFTYEGAPFSTGDPWSPSDTDGDNDGFTPAYFLDTAPQGANAHLEVSFSDMVADCVSVTWGAQRLEVLPTVCGVDIVEDFVVR